MKFRLAELRQFCSQQWVVLRALPGCPEQQPHLDYSPRIEFTAGYKPHLCLLAVEEGTQLEVWPGSHTIASSMRRKEELKHEARFVKKTIHIPVGSCVLFRHQLVHAGSAYTAANYRFHCYLDVREKEDHTNSYKIVSKWPLSVLERAGIQGE